MRGSIIEPICLGTIGAVNDTSRTRMLDPRDCLFVLYHDEMKLTEKVGKNTNGIDGLRENTCDRDMLQFVAS